MGIIKLHNNFDEVLNNIKSVAKIPFKASPWRSIYNDSDNSIIKKYEDINYGLAFSLEDINKLKSYLNKYYSTKFSDELTNILIDNYNKYLDNYLLNIHETRLFDYLYSENFINKNQIANLKLKNNELNEKINNLELKTNKLNEHSYIIQHIIDVLAWWIPVKKWRNNFRNKFVIDTKLEK